MVDFTFHGYGEGGMWRRGYGGMVIQEGVLRSNFINEDDI